MKPGEELREFRILVASAPVGGKGPRPKRELLLTLELVPPDGSAPRRARATEGARGGNGARRAGPKRTKPPKTRHDDDARAGTPVGGPGKKRTP